MECCHDVVTIGALAWTGSGEQALMRVLQGLEIKGRAFVGEADLESLNVPNVLRYICIP
jgi:hypothetical protein